MPDTAPILRLLRDLVRRARTNRLLQELADSVGGALAVWLLMALWNATMPRQVVLGWPFFALVAVAAVIRTVIRCARPMPLGRAAARADAAADLTDEMTSAYWFVRHPQEDDWVGLHVERAADTARSLDGGTLLPVRRPQRLGLAAGCFAGLMAVALLPVPRVFENVVDRLGDIAMSEEPLDESMEALTALEEADTARRANEPPAPLADEQLLLPQPGDEAQTGENALEEDSALEEQEPDPEGQVTEGDEAGEEGEAGEDGEQTQTENPEDMPADTEGEQAPDPNASQQEGQGESTEESGTTLPGGDEVFLQQGTDEADQPQLGEEEVGHATREGGEEQDLMQGELSTLEVELQREILALPDEEPEEETEEQEEELIIKAEASRLEFQTVESPSEFAEQEIMQTETVPWGYRDLVRLYFKTLRARDNQKEDEGR